jgi:hypothetical protein
MVRLLFSLVLMTTAMSQAFADDSVSRATPTKHQAMKECIEKQKTADVTMSKSQMTRICKDELRRRKELGESTPPPTDTPHNP